MNQANATTALILGVCSIVALLWGGYKWVRPRLQEAKADRIAQRDAIIGRPAIKDSITGKELAPALPGIGQRMANTEQQMTLLAEAMTKFADSHQRINDLDERVTLNSDRLTALEQMRGERVLSKVEQIQLLKTMDSALRSDSSDYEGDTE